MAHIHADGVADTTTTTGTGAVTVSGTAPTGFRTFSAVCSTNDTFFYAIRHRTASEWEVGLGTYSASNEVTRTTVLKSSNANAAVDFASGTKDVFISAIADRDNPRLGGVPTDNAVARFDGTTGNLQNSGVIVDDSNNVSGVATLTTTGSIELGNASDTTIARSGAGDATIEGNQIYRAGGTDVALADGGTGVSLTDPNADRLMFWDDSAGNVAWLTAGSGLSISGTTITATGASGLTLLATLTASSSATLDDTTSITSSYDTYLITFENVLNATNTQQFYIRITTDGGSNWQTTAYVGPSGVTSAVVPASWSSSPAATSFDNGGSGFSGHCFFTNPNSTANQRLFWGPGLATASGTVTNFYIGGRYTTTGSAINGLRFMFASGNITSGKIRIYGVSTS